MFFEGKIIGKWEQPTSEWITKHCYPYNVPKVQRLPYSIMMQCGYCIEQCYLPITELQNQGFEIIKCPICDENNLI
jgi:hypothetical protein